MVALANGATSEIWIGSVWTCNYCGRRVFFDPYRQPLPVCDCLLEGPVQLRAVPKTYDRPRFMDGFALVKDGPRDEARPRTEPRGLPSSWRPRARSAPRWRATRFRAKT